MDFGLTVVVDVVVIKPPSLGAADRDLDRDGALPLPYALNAATLPIVFDGIAMFGVFERALLDFADGLRALAFVVEVKPEVLCDDDALAFFQVVRLTLSVPFSLQHHAYPRCRCRCHSVRVRQSSSQMGQH